MTDKRSGLLMMVASINAALGLTREEEKTDALLADLARVEAKAAPLNERDIAFIERATRRLKGLPA